MASSGERVELFLLALASRGIFCRALIRVCLQRQSRVHFCINHWKFRVKPSPRIHPSFMR